MISNPISTETIENFLRKKPFVRGATTSFLGIELKEINPLSKTRVKEFSIKAQEISQAQYLRELDPYSHDIMTNSTVPRTSLSPNTRYDMAQARRIAFPFQKKILGQRVQYACGNKMQLTLLNQGTDESVKSTFNNIKEEWISRNMEIRKKELFRAQMACGDAAILHYKDSRKRYKTKVYSYMDGYTLIPVYDLYGELDVFTFLYTVDSVVYADIYDSRNKYSFINEENGWKLNSQEVHGFDEVPVTYKRGNVAWEDGQIAIDTFEYLYNIYMLIEKKIGFPILYIIGNYDSQTTKQQTATILNDKGNSEKSDAKFLNPSEPKGMQNLLNDIYKKIQISTSTVLLSADDINVSADISGVALKIMRSASYEQAEEDCKEYDECADSMIRLFMFGVASELGVMNEWGICKVRAEFIPWIPQSDGDKNQQIATLKSAGCISRRTAVERNSFAEIDEWDRIEREEAAIVETNPITESNTNP